MDLWSSSEEPWATMSRVKLPGLVGVTNSEIDVSSILGTRSGVSCLE